MTTDPSPEPTASKPATRRSYVRGLFHWARRLLLVCLVLGVVYVLWTNHRGEVAKQRITDKLTSRNIPLAPRYARWDTERPDPTQDGTRFYEAAFKLRPTGNYDLPYVSIADDPGHCEKISPELLTRIDEAIAENAKFFEMIDYAQKYNHFFYDVDFTNPFLPGGERLSGTRSVGRWLQIKNLRSQGVGDANEAVETWLAIDHVTRSLRAESQLFTVLVQISLDFLSVDVLEGMLSRLILDESQLDSIGDAVKNRNQKTFPTDAIASEITATNDLLQDIHYYHDRNYSVYLATKQTIEKFPYFTLGDEPIPSPWHFFFTRIWSALCPGWYELELADQIDTTLADYDRLKTLGDDPKIWRSFALEEVPDDSPVQSLRATCRIWLKAKAKARVTHVALNIEAYRVREGDWPKDLTVFGKARIDPYTGNPLIYSSRPDGVIVYSIGLNAQDEKGSEDYDGDNDYRSDDIAFTLYDTDIRNSKAPESRPEPEVELNPYAPLE